jgi:hypothetical protein
VPVRRVVSRDIGNRKAATVGVGSVVNCDPARTTFPAASTAAACRVFEESTTEEPGNVGPWKKPGTRFSRVKLRDANRGFRSRRPAPHFVMRTSRPFTGCTGRAFIG